MGQLLYSGKDEKSEKVEGVQLILIELRTLVPPSCL